MMAFLLGSEDDADDRPPFPPSSRGMMIKRKFKVIDSPPEGKKKTRAETKGKKQKKKKMRKEKERHQVANEAAASKTGGAQGSRQSYQVISTTEEKEELRGWRRTRCIHCAYRAGRLRRLM